ncbi:uncharacterized protein J4E84_000022 [Alternaria hordeiaustralica]|uniref:uncharacterized protein n=1 Tax=Alternaria hordeiaustralica TaxID=1187925 RepID=UPI0020C2409E|nr:uncharacterized protein J4E84_000022 [Alternaria hordeiaustralica]KAI4696899.1 hypothetical protein J4E84_000022 [Alternaria hordeiaustralica]
MAGYASRLQSQSEFLFKDEKVAVDFLDYRELDNRFSSACVKNQRELELILSCRHSLTPEAADPRCRFISSTFGDEKTLLASPETTVSPELPSVSSDGGADKDDKFTFKNLQAIQHIEEKAQEAMLVLKLNTEVLEQLRLHYDEVAEHAEFPQELKDGCKANLHRFNKGIIGVEKDMHMLQSRTETLLHLLANRKNLMSGILQHRSSKASEFYAKESRESAARMEIMTVKMQDLAMKTKQETVSMRVITTVTLFFLPATFIATFMSTDILNFEHGKQDLQMQGLRLYLMIALPATALTFVAWYFIYYFARREARSNDQSEAVGEA